MNVSKRLCRWLAISGLLIGCSDPTSITNARSAPSQSNAVVQVVRPWVTLAPDVVARDWTATAGLGGKLYVIGGEAGSGITAELTVFDPTSGAWSALAPMPVPTQAFLGAQALTGKIYVPGGEVFPAAPSAVVRVYDPSSNTWSTTTSLPVAACCGGSAVISGKLYALTGSEASCCAFTGSLFSYDGLTKQWKTLAPNPVLREWPAVAAAGGKLYAVGGFLPTFQESADLTVFDPATGVWQSKAPIPVARYGAAAVAYGAQLVVFGGFGSGGTALGDVWLYDPASNTWRSVPTTGFVPRGFLGAAVVSGAAYAVDGRLLSNGGGTATDVLQRILP